MRYSLLKDDEGQAAIEKVHKEDIRPQLLPQKGKKWVIGDVAEALDNQC